MIPAAELRDALLLTRPRQWPILSFQLAVGVSLAATAATPEQPLDVATTAGRLGAAWLAWVFLLNGGTLAFNSAYDRDTEPVAYLPTPPPAPAWLPGATLAAMSAGALVGWLCLGSAFGLLTACCTILSICYSHPRLRWKAVPGLDLLVNMVGYGAGTTLAGLLVGQALVDPRPVWVDQLRGALAGGGGWFTAGFALLFGSLYPLTQLYQMEADRGRGDRTLALALGLRPALALALVLGLFGGASFAAGLLAAGGTAWILLPAAACLLWLAHLVRWWVQAPGLQVDDHARGMYRALALWAICDVALLAAWWL